MANLLSGMATGRFGAVFLIAKMARVGHVQLAAALAFTLPSSLSRPLCFHGARYSTKPVGEGRRKRARNRRGRRRKKIFYLKFSKEDPEEEISTFKPAELCHYQIGGGTPHRSLRLRMITTTRHACDGPLRPGPAKGRSRRWQAPHTVASRAIPATAAPPAWQKQASPLPAV